MTDSAADKMEKYMSRPSAETVAAQVQKVQAGKPAKSGREKGFRCPRCHTINFDRVLETRMDVGMKVRRRECRNCGEVFKTMETYL